MTSSLNHHRASQKRVARTFILQFFIIVAAAVVVLSCAPSHAYAKSYTCPSVTIDAQANADGSLDVTEARTFDFSGNFTAVWWSFDNMPTKESMLSVKSVSLTNESTGETQTLFPVEFQRAWREAGGAGYPSYSVDEDENTVYVFFDESDCEVTMTLSYSISNFVQVYDDVAEVYWQYIGHGWAVDSDHVTTTLTVPVPAGTQVRAGDNVRAWGHGPLDGSLSIGDDGAIYAQVSSVSAGGYAEIHSVFPADWMNVSGSAANKHMGNRLDSVLEDEAQLANKANASRLQSLLFIVVCLVAAIGVIVWAVFMFFRHGREYKPQFQDTYWRDVPAKGLSPAVIGRLWRFDAESPNDLIATLMHLSHIGAIRLDAGSYEAPNKGLFGMGGSKTVNDYYITRLPGWEEKVVDPIDKKTMDLVFKKIAKGADSLWFGTIQQFGTDYPESFNDAMESWQGVVSAETNKCNFFEEKGSHYRVVFFVLAVLLGLVGVFSLFVTDEFTLFLAFIPPVVVLAVLSKFMQRRSREAVEIHAKCVGLRNWLKDFSALDERLPTDVKVWGEMMVYAYVFGVAEEAMKALQMKLPQVIQDEGFATSTGYWLMPHYYGMPGGAAAPVASPAEMFQTMQTNTMQTVSEALSAASSSDGSGGGFSGGGDFGGGGFGGGGGGAR